MLKIEPITKTSLLLATILSFGSFFLFDNNIPVQALHKEEEILEDYDDLAEFANAVRNGDEDLEEIPIESMEAADIYEDADDSMKDCIDLAAKIGDSLSDREVTHCVDDVNYFKNKYSSNSSVAANATFDTSTIPTVTDTDTETDDTSTSETSTSDDDTSTSETSTSDDDTSTSETSTSDDDTSTSETSTSDDDTSTSETSTSDDDTSTSETSSFDNFQNNLIDELVKTGKFTEDEAREFMSNNMMSGTDSAVTSDDTQTTSDTDTSTTGTQTTSDTDISTDEISSSNNESTDDNASGSNTKNLEAYDNLSELVDDIKNGDIDNDENSLNDFQNSGAYKGADQETQDCIDLAGKIGSNLIDYEIVRCSDDPNHFKNQISNNNNSDENNDT